MGSIPSSALRFIHQSQVLDSPPWSFPRPVPPTVLWTGHAFLRTISGSSWPKKSSLQNLFPTYLSRPLSKLPLARAEYFIFSRMFLNILPLFPLSGKPFSSLSAGGNTLFFQDLYHHSWPQEYFIHQAPKGFHEPVTMLETCSGGSSQKERMNSKVWKLQNQTNILKINFDNKILNLIWELGVF